MINHYKEGSVVVIALLLIVSGLFLSNNNNNITGDTISQLVGTRVNVSPAAPYNCLFEIKEGFSILSFPCVSDYTPMNNFLTGLGNDTSKMTAIFSYTGQSDPWQAYNPNLPDYVVQDLTYMTRKKGYIFFMNESDIFNYSGYLAETPTVPISNGWTLASYPLNETKILPDGIQSINDTFIIMETYYNNRSGKQGYYSYYDNFTGNLTELEMYQGYWINSSSSDLWSW